MKKPSALKLDGKGWGFAQILSLAEALCSGEIHDDIWLCLKRINRIRNDMAHNLEPKDLEDRVKELIETWPAATDNVNVEDAIFMNLSSIFVAVSSLASKPSENVIKLVEAE